MEHRLSAAKPGVALPHLEDPPDFTSFNPGYLLMQMNSLWRVPRSKRPDTLTFAIDKQRIVLCSEGAANSESLFPRIASGSVDDAKDHHFAIDDP